jgi:hypothetical protein
VSLEDATQRAVRSRELILLLVGIGIALRVAQYAANRSLWIDEAWLALNLLERPLSGLTKSLDFNQAAPVGFLLAEGAMAKLLGYGEWVLRLLPLLFGLVSVPAFGWLARRMLSTAAAPLAVLLFVVADGLIYYSSEFKPYGIDASVAVGLLAAGALLSEEGPLRSRTALAVALVGLALLSLSFPAVFVLTAVVAALSGRFLFDWREARRFPRSLAVVLWIPGVGAIVAFSASRVEHVRQSLEGSLGVAGSTSPLHEVNVMGTELAAAIGFSQQPPYNQLEKLALLCALAGAIALFRRNSRHLLMLTAPMALLFVAAEIHVYPILLRTELFLVPAVVLLIAEGVAQLVRWVPARSTTVTALILTIAVGSGPVWLAGSRLVHPRTREEIRPVLEFVRDHWRPGDTLYVHHGAQYAFLYYEECKCLRLSRPGTDRNLWPVRPLPAGPSQDSQAAVPLSSAVVLGRYYPDLGDEYVADLNRVRGRRRVWFLYTHVSGDQEQAFIQGTLLRHMASLGNRVNGIDLPGAHAYLYERGGAHSR